MTRVRIGEPTTFKYLTVEECYRRNGHRHLERAISYYSAGYPDRFGDGSMRKAIREYKKADLFKIPNWQVEAIAIVTNAIANNIMNGCSDVAGLRGLLDK